MATRQWMPPGRKVHLTPTYTAAKAPIMNWPGPGGTNQVRMQLGLTNGSTATLVTNGSWALNRFFDKARTSPGAGSLSRQATFNVDGHQVTLEFAPNSIRNPFQLPRFSCP